MTDGLVMDQQLTVSTVESELASTNAGVISGVSPSPETRLYSSEEEEQTCEITPDPKTYPFALVLRLRVMQIVCGISAMVMGTVALIEERGNMNLGLGVPAGLVTVVAASLSIHYSRGFSGYEAGGCACARLRWLGPNPRTAALLAALWGTAALLVAALGVRAAVTLVQHTHLPSSDVTVLAAVQLSLAVLVVGTAAAAIRVDCSRDPD